MAERYEDQYRRDRGYRRDDRGLIDRAGDEVRSWFGDDDAERRRQMDDRDRYYGSGRYYGEGPERGTHAERYWDRPSWMRPFGRDAYGGDRFPIEREWTDRPREGTYYGPAATSGYDPREHYGAGHPGAPAYPGTLRDRDWDDRNRERGMGWYAGRGPRGYQRSDARINEDVCDRLCDSPDVDATDIDVRVANGEITLSGSVADREQKRRAEDLIEQVSGVREVHNNLRVSHGQDTTSSTRPAGASATGEQPGNVLGVTGAPDRTATTARR
jgi:osmotically-inducible protein OsmY